jgi:hypothetical protein
MGEAERDALRVGFEGTIKLEFHGATFGPDAGRVRHSSASSARAR